MPRTTPAPSWARPSAEPSPTTLLHTTAEAFEWTGADGLVGITAVELGADGLITRVTSVYDGRQLPVDRRADLLDATFGP